MKHIEVRNRFLDFFKDKGHTLVPSDSLVPAGDPTLLFTSAGMTQFKEQFMGSIKGFRRAATCQKCLRTGDLENVGKTAYHHTFFEMLGNFSFGDYFKKDAITWAWEFLTSALKLPGRRLWVSVYEEDEEAYDIWKRQIRIPGERIVRFGQKDNFWPSEAKDKGPNGPCGPCSEIFFDYGKSTGCGKDDCSPACGCGRFVEVWNLVFTQFERQDKGILKPLPNRNIDTGMGLERLCAVLQGVKSNFETGLFSDIIKPVRESMPRAAEPADNSNIYAIADHIRAVTFAISDGIAPSNEERGYVIRSLIRKAVMRAKALGIEKPFLYRLVYAVAKTMELPYPEIMREHQDIAGVIKTEEERFCTTLENGIPKIEEAVLESKKGGNTRLSGAKAFELYDTHGIPLEVIRTTAAMQGASVDEAGFNDYMQKQREASKSSSKIESDIFTKSAIKEKTEFIGYDRLESSAYILRMMDRDGNVISRADKDSEAIEVIPDKSVFYGEQGGQVGDKGILSRPDAEFLVEDSKKLQEAIVLFGRVTDGSIRTGDKVNARVDADYRKAVARNHTATHLLQDALRKVLGEHVKQQGSFVAADRLRFDFTHPKAVTEDELARLEEIVNGKIKAADDIRVEEMPLKDARRSGALAFFGEKYEQRVRVVNAGGYSRELCGGTHSKNTSEIGLFKIMRESSVASGIRRIEACTAANARQWERELEKKQKDRESALKMKEKEKLLEKKRLKESEGSVGLMIENAADKDGIKVIINHMGNQGMAVLKHVADIIRNRLKGDYILFLAASQQDKALTLLCMSNGLAGKGPDAVSFLSDIVKPFDGKAGGRRDMAQGGIKGFNDKESLISKAEEVLLKESG